MKVEFKLLLRRLGTVTGLVLLIPLSSPPVGAQPNAPATEALPADEKLGEAKTSSLEKGGFQLEVPMWKPKAHAGSPTSLLAKYEWGGQGDRSASGVPVGPEGKPNAWRISFPDQPKPDELARISLFYAFELTEEGKKSLVSATSGLIDAVMIAAAEAATEDEGDFVEKFAQASRALATSAQAKTLRQYGDEAGNDGLALVLQQLGITLRSDGSWMLTAQAREGLVVHASAQVKDHAGAQNTAKAMAIALERLKRATPPNAPGKCSPGADPSKLDSEKAKPVILGCASLLETQLRSVAGAETDANQKKFLQETADGLQAALAHGEQEVVAFRDRTFGDLAVNVPLIGSSYAYNATVYAIYVVAKEGKDAAWTKRIEQLKSRVTAVVEQTSRVEIGSLLVAGGVQPRRYDIATGAVFVSGIKDVVLPMLISICPAAGCLKPDEVAWSAPLGWLRAFSVDAGIRAKTLDTQDPRQSDKLSFLVGVSYNPVTVLRVSAGGYAFENAQDHRHWNLMPYVGITFNVLNAAELLGGLGPSSQFEPRQVTPN